MKKKKGVAIEATPVCSFGLSVGYIPLPRDVLAAACALHGGGAFGYAAGVMLNVMLTGKHPSEKMAKGRAGKIVRKCTFVSPEERFQSAEKLKKAL